MNAALLHVDGLRVSYDHPRGAVRAVDEVSFSLRPRERFGLAGDLKGKKVLEVGCGEGVASVQLAYCGAVVTGIDISEQSIRVARRRAALQGVAAAFEVSPSSAIRWVARFRQTGSAAAKPMGGKRSALDAHKPWLLELTRSMLA